MRTVQVASKSFILLLLPLLLSRSIFSQKVVVDTPTIEKLELVGHYDGQTTKPSDFSRDINSSFNNKQAKFISSSNARPNRPEIGESTQSRLEKKHQFRIGLIVPRTSFLSQYKTYTQRIKDTFAQLLQLSRHQQHQKLTTGGQGANIDTLKPSSSICLTSSSPGNGARGLQRPHKQQTSTWLSDLTFNQYYDIKVVDLVNLTPRSSASDIVNSMCQKLIEQNVSVIVYLENNQDQTVTSLDSQTAIQNLIRPFKHSNRLKITPIEQSNTSHEHDNLNYRLSMDSAANEETKATRPTTRSSLSGFRQPSSQAHFMMHLAHSAGIPMIAWSVTGTLAHRPKKQRILHLAPTVAHEARAMLAIMERYSWHSFSVVSTVLAGHEDFILALRQYTVASNGGKPFMSNEYVRSRASINPGNHTATTMTTTMTITVNNASNITVHEGGPEKIGQQQEQPEASRAFKKIFKLLDVITIKKRTLTHIEEQLRQLTVSESRVVLLYATKGEAIDILKMAKKLKLTKRSYAWIVAQSVIGPNEDDGAPMEFHPGLLGIYFRSNHERLLDELSRAITIIAHGLERLVRDNDGIFSKKTEDQTKPKSSSSEDVKFGSSSRVLFKRVTNEDTVEMSEGRDDSNRGILTNNSSTLDYYGLPTATAIQQNQITSSEKVEMRYKRDLRTLTSLIQYRQELLTARSSCSHKLDSIIKERADLLYEYFRGSSPSNVFDADGSLKDVELNVVNLDNERQWKRIGCFADSTLTIDDITWPDRAERPPSGTMEKFHLRAVFLEEPSFVNLADPDSETGECKTNRAVRCRFKVARPPAETGILDSASDMSRTDPIGRKQFHLHANNSQDVNQRKSSNQMHEINGEFEHKCCSGFCIDLMEKFATDLKFSYDLYRVPDGRWGILENNTWNGLINEIMRSKADVVVSSIKINSDRQKAVDFTVPFLDTGISILVAKQTGVISKLAFLEPFDTLAWIMFICVGIPLAATSIFYFEWLSPSGFYAKKGYRTHKSTHPVGNYAIDKLQVITTGLPSSIRERHKFSFCRTLWLVITILFGSAAHIDSPKGYTARFMSNVWATFAVVFLAVYTANLAAFMITREEYLELSGMSDSRLAYPYHRNPPLRFGTINGGNTHAVLSANKPNLYNYMRQYNRPTVEDGVDAVKSGQLDAFVYDAVVLDYLAAQDPECKLVNVGSWYSMTGYALAFPRNSRYYEKFNMKMLDYRKNGELDRLRRFWLQGLCKPGQNRHSISKPLDLSQFMSAFLLLGAGILGSVLILALEHLYIIYARDRLIKSRYRKNLIEWIYPFSLSLADTLRQPGDEEEKLSFGNKNENVRDQNSKQELLDLMPIIETPTQLPKVVFHMDHFELKRTRSRSDTDQGRLGCNIEHVVNIDRVNSMSCLTTAQTNDSRTFLTNLKCFEDVLENMNNSISSAKVGVNMHHELESLRYISEQLRNKLSKVSRLEVKGTLPIGLCWHSRHGSELVGGMNRDSKHEIHSNAQSDQSFEKIEDLNPLKRYSTTPNLCTNSAINNLNQAQRRISHNRLIGSNESKLTMGERKKKLSDSYPNGHSSVIEFWSVKSKRTIHHEEEVDKQLPTCSSLKDDEKVLKTADNSLINRNKETLL